MIFIKGHDDPVYPVNSCFTHKYLNDDLKILRLLQLFPEVAQNSLRIPSFPCSGKSLSIPGLWPPCLRVVRL